MSAGTSARWAERVRRAPEARAAERLAHQGRRAAALRAFLEGAALPADDLSVEKQAFTLAVEAGRIVGTVALELVGPDALLRSLAVAPEWRRHDLGAQLDDGARAQARRPGVSALYLLTSTAREYLSRRGHEVVARAEVPAAVLGLPQFESLCPASATCMRSRLAGG